MVYTWLKFRNTVLAEISHMDKSAQHLCPRETHFPQEKLECWESGQPWPLGKRDEVGVDESSRPAVCQGGLWQDWSSPVGVARVTRWTWSEIWSVMAACEHVYLFVMSSLWPQSKLSMLLDPEFRSLSSNQWS